MEFINFSSTERQHIEKALGFITKTECDTTLFPADLPIIKTENYLQDCEKLLDPERTIGTESPYATVIFPNNRTSTHKVLVNGSKFDGLAYVFSITTELIHLHNFMLFFKDNGHLYTFTQEKMVERNFHEFLLWSKFQAKKISTRTFLLTKWHEVNGEAPPAGGQYQFEGISIDNTALLRCLDEVTTSDNVTDMRELFWFFIGELALYFGSLSFYQQEPQPELLDSAFPVETLDKWVGMETLLQFYTLLLSCSSYQEWLKVKQELRTCVLAMEKQCKQTLLDTSGS